MSQTIITLPDDIQSQVEQYAQKNGVSVDEIFRLVFRDWLKRQAIASSDPLYAGPVYDEATPPDLSANHDAYLYGTDDAVS